MRAFGEVFAVMIKRRGMSVSAAASELGFSSKTALFRILNGQSKSASNRKCMEAACASELFALTQQEIDELERALRIGEMGKQAFAMNQLMHTLVDPPIPSEPLAPVPLMGGGFGDVTALFDACASLSRIRVDIFGGCSQGMLAALRAFSERADVSGIRHIFAVDNQSTEHIRVLSEAAFVLFCPVYSVYIINETDVQEKNWLFHSGILLLNGVTEGGEQKTYLLTPVREGYHLIVTSRSEPNALFSSLISEAQEHIQPLKRVLRSASELAFPDNCVEMTAEYALPERDRELYLMKPDLSLSCIPPELMMAVVRDTVEATGHAGQAKQALERLYTMQRERFNNLFGKKKVTHMVFNLEAMFRFARTGIRADHFRGARPYTPQERVQILQNLRYQMIGNPYFHVWFGKSRDLGSDKEIAAYEGYGVSMIKPDPSRQLDANQRGIILESRTLVSTFKEYLLNDVLPREVFPCEQNLRIVEELMVLASSRE